MTDLINWGILGNANIARSCIIPAIQSSHNGTVRGLGTRTPSQAEEIANKHNIPHIYPSYQAVIEDPAVDAVYNPLPNHLHHGWTIKALKQGKHVLCEKPLACNTTEATEMVQAARETGKVLMEAFSYRFHPRSQRIKTMVKDGLIGKPHLIRSAFCFQMGEELLQSGNNARLKPEMGGGALMDVGCYGVSLARWILDAEPEMVQAQALYHPNGVDQHFVGLLRFPQDVLATVEASFITALQQTYTVVGTQGAIELPHDAYIPWEKDAVFTLRCTDEEVGQDHCIPGADGYKLMIEHFADVILGKASPLYGPEDSIRTMKVLDALAQAARTGRSLKVG
ncbi:MAG: Gfo/Idh/MocA family oxidoreductase [Thermodesulfobacteriota bacterium]|nr:Gfo/Idh/MocA family oxidoreductase [Thermodesulfobacteriota bacterium]